MQIHSLKPRTKRQKPKLVGRGGKRGKTSGRGMKGQKSRSGRKMRPEMRDIIKKIPKLRGRGKNIFTSIEVKPQIVNLQKIDKFYSDGETVSPKTLIEKKVVRVEKGFIPKIKILGDGTLTKKITVEGCFLSASARATILKTGGVVR